MVVQPLHSFHIETPRSKKQVQVELFNCDIDYLKTVKSIISIHGADHSVALFLAMKEQADLALYCHPLLSFENEKEYIINYTQKFNYPLAILTRIEDLDDLFITNGVPTKFRRWCWRIFKIEPAKLFYRRFVPSGIIEYIGIQQWQSRNRAKMNPQLIEDKKSTKRYKIYRKFPVFYFSYSDNLALLKQFNIPFNPNVTEFNRHGCFLCPFAGRDYYEQIKKEQPSLFQECQRLMKLGSLHSGTQYYYYPNTCLI